MATYAQAATPGAPRRSNLSYACIGVVAGLIGTSLALATGPAGGEVPSDAYARSGAADAMVGADGPAG